MAEAEYDIRRDIIILYVHSNQNICLSLLAWQKNIGYCIELIDDIFSVKFNLDNIIVYFFEINYNILGPNNKSHCQLVWTFLLKLA